MVSLNNPAKIRQILESFVNTKGKESRGSYLARFKTKISKEDLERRELAYDMAKDIHRDQVRESGERYFEHVRTVSVIAVDLFDIYSNDIHIPCLLHDSKEDRLIMSGRFLQFVFGAKIFKIIELVTKPNPADPLFKGRSKKELLDLYHKNLLKSSNKAKLVKLCDRLHNLLTLGECPPEKQKRKIMETVIHYEPMIQMISKHYPKEAKIFSATFKEAIEKLREGLNDKDFWQMIEAQRAYGSKW